MSYILSEELKKELLKIDGVTCGDGSIESINRIKDFYGISQYEEILGYKRYPRAIPRILKGGIVFSDVAIYKMWPVVTNSIKETFWASSSYISTVIKYDELLQYFPCVGFVNNKQPELIGQFSENANLSLWQVNTINDKFSNGLIEVLVSIQKDIIASDSGAMEIFVNTVEKAIHKQLDCVDNKEKNELKKTNVLIKKYIDVISLSDEKWNDLAFVFCAECMFDGDIKGAIDYLDVYENANISDCQKERKNNFINNSVKAIENIEENNVEGIKNLGLYDNVYALSLFDKYSNYYFSLIENCEDKDEVVDILTKEILNYINEIKEIDIKNNIMLELNDRMQLFLNDVDTIIRDEEYFPYVIGLLMFSMNFDYYSLALGRTLEYCCKCKKFSDARDAILYAKKMEDKFSEKAIENYGKYVEEQAKACAIKSYKIGLEKKENENYDEAIVSFKKSVDFCPREEEYIISLIETEIMAGYFQDARKDIIHSNKDGIITNEFETKYNSLKVECSEGIINEFKPLFQLLKNEDGSVLKFDKTTLEVRDQFGLTCYHYGIILKNEDYVENYNVEDSLAYNPVNGFGLLEFACEGERANQTFAYLLYMYDDDYKQLRDAYQKRKKVLERNEKIVGTISSFLDYVEKDASKRAETDEEYEKIENFREQRNDLKNKYYDSLDRSLEIKNEKRMKDLENAREDGFNQLLKVLSDFSICADSESLKETFDENVNELINIKYKQINNILEERLKKADFLSKFIYYIIKNPDCLKWIYQNEVSCALYEENSNFWYLPKMIVKDVLNIDEK